MESHVERIYGNRVAEREITVRTSGNEKCEPRKKKGGWAMRQ
jgi:hypothetical protein